LEHLGVGDWFAAIVTCMVAGVGAAMAWFKTSNNKRDAAIKEVKGKVEDCERLLAAHTTLIAVSQTCQKNIEEKLEDIKDRVEESAMRGAHSVNTQIAALTSEIQKVVAKQRRHDSD